MSDFIPHKKKAPRTPEERAEQYLRMCADLDAFERDLDVDGPRAGVSQPPHPQLTSHAHWSRASRVALAAAACLVMGVVAWMISAQRGGAPQEVVVAPAPDLPTESPESPIVDGVVAPLVTPVVHRVVALFRGDTDDEGRCPDCWCVAQWSPNWGEGRGTNDLHEEELVQASLTHACVSDPRRVVIVGLTGPASAMPKSEAEALEMSLCLLKKQSAQFPVSLVDNTSAYCLPTGVDYCMTTWDK